MIRRLASCAAAACIGLCAGCSAGSTGAPADASAAPPSDALNIDEYEPQMLDAGIAHTYAPTWSAVWGEIVHPSCALVFCHGAAGFFLDMSTKDTAYKSLVGVLAGGRGCGDSGLERVQPGDPSASLLYLKVTSPPCGDLMPQQASMLPMLDSRETGQIFAWIEAGAPDD